MQTPLYPSLYQVNTRVWLTELSRQLGRPTTLDDIPDAELDRLKLMGFDWIWFLSVWQTGPAGQQVSRTNAEWRREFRDTLPDLRDEDIAGSGFAIAGYTVHPLLGGQAALARLRERLRQRDLKLLLDFVPNHLALDHPWVEQHPERFVHGSEADLHKAPQNYCRVKTRDTSVILAHGRDPYFPGWPDTLQLDYSDPATQDAMIGELRTIAAQCDGLRCDMAMLVLPEVFERTWGRRAPLFWPRATAEVRQRVPGFCFMAEVYWDLEWTMQQQGFDYAYDKRLYDRLRERQARPVREHLYAGLDYQSKLARFMENHDEPRAASTFAPDVHQAAAIVTFLSPGLRFFHQGQLEGRRTRISPHLIRAPQESTDTQLAAFYGRLLDILRHDVTRNGQWQLLECVAAWDGNATNDDVIAWSWRNSNGEFLLVTVNYAPHQSQCYVRLPFGELGNGRWRLRDLLGEAVYDRDGNDMRARGLYLDASAWQASVFSVTALK
jgi:glycosidase